MSLNLSGAFVHIYWINFLKIINFFIPKVQNFFTYFTCIHFRHHAIYHNQVTFCWFSKLFQDVVRHLNELLEMVNKGWSRKFLKLIHWLAKIVRNICFFRHVEKNRAPCHRLIDHWFNLTKYICLNNIVAVVDWLSVEYIL